MTMTKYLVALLIVVGTFHILINYRVTRLYRSPAHHG